MFGGNETSDICQYSSNLLLNTLSKEEKYRNLNFLKKRTLNIFKSVYLALECILFFFFQEYFLYFVQE